MQQRNKPKEPPKPPEKAPFFIPTLPGIEARFDLPQNNTKSQSKKSTRRLDAMAQDLETEFIKRLTTASANNECELQ